MSLTHNRHGYAVNNKFTYSAAISAATLSGNFEDTRFLFDQMKSLNIRRDVVIYNAMMTACSRAALFEEVSTFFNLILSDGLEPDIYSYNSYLSACIHAHEYAKALEVIVQLKESNVEEDAVTYCNIITLLGRLRRTDEVVELLKRVRKKRVDVRVYNAAIYVLATSSDRKCLSMAYSTLYTMRVNDKVMPQTDTYNGLLAGLARHGRSNAALVCLHTMYRHGIHPDKLSYTCVINACGTCTLLC